LAHARRCRLLARTINDPETIAALQRMGEEYEITSAEFAASGLAASEFLHFLHFLLPLQHWTGPRDRSANIRSSSTWLALEPIPSGGTQPDGMTGSGRERSGTWSDERCIERQTLARY
jgi:hypothetical protein